MQTHRHPPVHRIDCSCHRCGVRVGRRRRHALEFAALFLAIVLLPAAVWLLRR